jgi:acyl carrier protein
MPTREIIREFIHKNFILDEGDHLKDEDSLLEKGVIDSTGVLELVAFIEEKYGITVEDEELIPENLDSIRNIAEFIWQKTKATCNAEVGQSVAP